MKGSARGFIYLIIGIVVALGALFAINYGMEYVNTNKLKKEATEVMEYLVSKGDEYKEKKQFQDYAIAKYKEKGYKDEELTKVEVVIRDDGSLVLYNELAYVSIWGSILQKNDMNVRAAIIGYKNKYSEWIIEEYDENKTYDVLTTTAINTGK